MRRVKLVESLRQADAAGADVVCQDLQHRAELRRLRRGCVVGVVASGDGILDPVDKLREAHLPVAVDVEERADVLHVSRGGVGQERANHRRNVRAVQRPDSVAIKGVKDILESGVLILQVPVEAIDEALLPGALEGHEPAAHEPAGESRPPADTRGGSVHAHGVTIHEVVLALEGNVLQVPIGGTALSGLGHPRARGGAVAGQNPGLEHAESVGDVVVADGADVTQVELTDKRSHHPALLRNAPDSLAENVENLRVSHLAVAKEALVSSQNLELLEHSLGVHVAALRGSLRRGDDVLDACHQLLIGDLPDTRGVEQELKKREIGIGRAGHELFEHGGEVLALERSLPSGVERVKDVFETSLLLLERRIEGGDQVRGCGRAVDDAAGELADGLEPIRWRRERVVHKAVGRVHQKHLALDELLLEHEGPGAHLHDLLRGGHGPGHLRDCGHLRGLDGHVHRAKSLLEVEEGYLAVAIEVQPRHVREQVALLVLGDVRIELGEHVAQLSGLQ